MRDGYEEGLRVEIPISSSQNLNQVRSGGDKLIIDLIRGGNDVIPAHIGTPAGLEGKNIAEEIRVEFLRLISGFGLMTVAAKPTRDALESRAGRSSWSTVIFLASRMCTGQLSVIVL